MENSTITETFLDAVDRERSEDKSEIMDEGRREVNKLRPMVELTEVRLIVPVSGRLLLGIGGERGNSRSTGTNGTETKGRWKT